VGDQLTYQDFDLLVESGSPGSYKARVLRSPAGESGPVDFTLPFSAEQLENFVLKVGRPRRGGTRGPGRPESAPLKAFGGQLYSAVFQDELHETLRNSVSVARAEGMGLRVRLRLRDTPELAGLPWEFLYDPRRNHFLALSHRTPLVRYLDLPDPPRPLSVEGPLRLLVMISSPSDYDTLDVEQEWRTLTGALAPLLEAGRVVVERLEAASLAALQPRLRREEFHVFHFIGHGGYRPDWADGVLVMEDRVGRGREVAGEELGGLLSDHDPMRLAVLNACEGARSDATDPFAGVAQSLIQQGLPAVVAMQFEITDDAAIILAHELYGAVADGYPLDAALAEARRAIRNDGNPTEWATPVLYSRAPDGRLFDLEARPPTTSVPPAATPGPTLRAQDPKNEHDTTTVTKPAPAAASTSPPWTEPVSTPVVGRPTTDPSETPVGKLEHSSKWGLLGPRAVKAVAFSPDGRLLASGSADKSVRVWEVASSRLQHTLDHEKGVLAVAFSPDGRLLASATDGKIVLLWAVASGNQQHVLRHHNAVSTVAFSPDGRLLASGSYDKSVRVWEVASGNQQHNLGHDSWVQSVAFSPDGRLLASGSEDKSVRVWEVASGRLQRTLGHDNLVRAVAFSPDGRLLASGSADKSVRVWEVASGNQQHNLRLDNWAWAVAFSPDGRLLAAGTGGNRVVLWAVQPAS
jgi:roadblock/LC7 domain-containing protein